MRPSLVPPAPVFTGAGLGRPRLRPNGSRAGVQPTSALGAIALSLTLSLSFFLLLTACTSVSSDDPIFGADNPPPDATTTSTTPPDGTTTPPPGTTPLRLLQANVGNVALTCGSYKYKLCYTDTEETLAASIQHYQADVVVLQEITTRDQCAAMTETDSRKVCYENRVVPSPDQARRLVGPDYTIACDTRYHYECIAVRRGWGTITNCALGSFCTSPAVAETAPPPGDADDHCDDGFSASAFVLNPASGAPPFRLVDIHPPSGSAVACRRAALVQVFAGAHALARGTRSLIAGDFNLDVYSDTDDSADYLRLMIAGGTRFHLHSGIAEHDPPYVTAVYPFGNTLGSLFHGSHVYDHVLSNFASGACSTLGEAPGSARLDAGTGTDHRALFCNLTL